MLFPSSKRLVLLNHNEVVIDARYLIHGEVVASGISIDLQVKRVVVGTQILPSPLVKKFSTNVEKLVPRSLDFSENLPSGCASKEVASCRPALDFSLGRDFEKRIFDKFRHQVNFIGGFRKRPFYLVCSFGRANFKLDFHTVSLALQACFGGNASKFQVKLLQDRTFRFSVASRAVGFEIYNISKFSCNSFVIHVNLWGNGGPNWIHEEREFYKESVKEWKVVTYKKESAKKSPSLKPSSKGGSVFQRLKFPASPAVPSPVTEQRINGDFKSGLHGRSYAQVPLMVVLSRW